MRDEKRVGEGGNTPISCFSWMNFTLASTSAGRREERAEREGETREEREKQMR